MTGRTGLELERVEPSAVRRTVEEFSWLSVLDKKISAVLCETRNCLSIRNKIPFQQPYLAPFPTHRFSLLSGSFSDMGGNWGKNILFPRKKTSCSINISYWIIYSLGYTFFPLLLYSMKVSKYKIKHLRRQILFLMDINISFAKRPFKLKV